MARFTAPRTHSRAEASVPGGRRLDEVAKLLATRPSRRRLLKVFGGGGGLLVAGRLAAPVTAQEATPAAAEDAAVSLEALAFAPIEELPTSPALVGLVRVTYPPGAVLPLEEGDPSLAVVYVESGELTVRLEAPATVYRAGEAGAEGSPEEVEAGVEFTVGPGDSFVSPAVIPGEARNAGTETVVVLAAVVEPAEATSPASTPDD